MSAPRDQAGRRRRGVQAPLALPACCAALLAVGAAAAASHGALSAGWVLALAAVITGCGAAAAELAVAPVLGVIAWLTACGFSAPPYAQLQLTGPVAVRAAIVLTACTAGGAAAGAVVRFAAASSTLGIVRLPGSQRAAAGAPAVRLGWSGGISGRRVIAGVLLVAGLPLLTAVLAAVRPHLADDLLIYLVVVVAVAIVGGFWPAVLAAITASVLLNWYFTPPVHTLTIADPQSLLALLLFVTVAVTVSSVVHLAAHRARLAARSSEEAAELLALAQTVLSGADTPAAVLEHLTQTRGGCAELRELAGRRWVTVAASGTAALGSGPLPETCCRVRADLELMVTGQPRAWPPRLLDGFAAQAAAALDRDRLRTQAAQAEALAAGNKMRTALLAAVSHDLRTPLASIKASVSTLRQTDVDWAPADEAALLAAIEGSADRLDALIGNLLDMSRLATGALQPFLRPTSVDEVAPVALLGLDGGAAVRLAVPDGLPLVRTDPGLLERVLANLFANALAYSPPGRPPVLRASPAGDAVLLEVIDSGPGVPDQHKAQIFEPFRRLAGGRQPDGGVGLGLAVAQGFAEIIGASLAAADTPGGGLTMRLTLPAAAAAAQPEPRPPGPGVAADP